MLATSLVRFWLRTSALALVMASVVRFADAMPPTMQMNRIAEESNSTVRTETSLAMPPMVRVDRSAEMIESPKTSIRAKRDCGGDCGCGCGGSGSEERKRRRRRNRKRANRLTHSIVHLLGSDVANNGTAPIDELEPPNRSTRRRGVLHDPPQPSLPLIIVANSTRVLTNNGDEVESAEVIIISPEGARDGSPDTSGDSGDSYFYSSETLINPTVNPNAISPPGGLCRSDTDCALGTVCEFVPALDGHRCVCEPPMVNYGNLCVPRSPSTIGGASSRSGSTPSGQSPIMF